MLYYFHLNESIQRTSSGLQRGTPNDHSIRFPRVYSVNEKNTQFSGRKARKTSKARSAFRASVRFSRKTFCVLQAGTENT